MTATFTVAPTTNPGGSNGGGGGGGSIDWKMLAALVLLILTRYSRQREANSHELNLSITNSSRVRRSLSEVERNSCESSASRNRPNDS